MSNSATIVREVLPKYTVWAGSPAKASALNNEKLSTEKNGMRRKNDQKKQEYDSPLQLIPYD